MTEWDPECQVVTWLIQPQVTDRRLVPLVVVCPLTVGLETPLVSINQTSSYTRTKCNLSRHPNARRDGPDLTGKKNSPAYVVHKGMRVRLSLLLVLGLFCE